MAKQKIVGYIDENGFTYCVKHGSPGMDAIFAGTPDSFDKCKVCEKWITNDSE